MGSAQPSSPEQETSYLLSLLSQTSTPYDVKESFSRANVFGLFFTISFCLLMQPYGSLLYVKPHNILGRVIFFFWRLNPLACIMEVILLAFVFIDGIWLAFRQSRLPLSSSTSFWNHLRTAATAIQLLRIHGKAPQHWRVLINSEPDYAPPPPPYAETQPNSRATLVGHHTTEPVGHTRSGSQDSTRSAGSYLDEPSRVTTSNHAELQSTDASINAAGHQDGQDLESGGWGSTQTEISSSIGSSRLIRNDLGRIVLGRADLVLDLVGTAGVVIVIIKLSSVAIPLHIRLPAIFMATSWVFVQVLNLVSNRRDADLVDRASIIRHTLALERKLNHALVWTLLSLLLLPLFGYLTFVTLFETRILPDSMRIGLTYFLSLYFLAIDPLLFYFLPRAFSSGRKLPYSYSIGGCPSPPAHPSRKALYWAVFHLCKGVIFFFLGWYLGESIMMCMYLDKPATAYYILPFSAIPCAIWAWIFLPGVPFMRRSSMGYQWVGGVSLFYNLAATGLFFTAAMTLYNANESYKPSWLDWLGKFAKF